MSFSSGVEAVGNAAFLGVLVLLMFAVDDEPGCRRIGIFMLVFEFSREMFGVLVALDWLLPLTELARELLRLRPAPVRFAVPLSRGVNVRADWFLVAVDDTFDVLFVATFRTEADLATTGLLSVDFRTELRTSVVFLLRTEDLGSLLPLPCVGVALTKLLFSRGLKTDAEFVLVADDRLYSVADRLTLCRVLVVL